MFGFLNTFFSSRNERLIKGYRKVVERINALEEEYRALDAAALRARTDQFRQRIAAGETLQDLLPETFAAVREAAGRTLGMRHFDVQLIGGMVLHDGKIAEMRTGEGKTLVATLPAYLNALSGQSVHVITVNDYLARRDSEWMGKVYEYLGLTVGTIFSGQSGEERKQAYQADIAYGTNNEFGFDYLRDHMSLDKEHRVQRDRAFAILDEVDSILIDEARTPLIISGPSDASSGAYSKVDKLVKQLKFDANEENSDYLIDEKARQVHLTEQGQIHAEELLAGAGLLERGGSLYDLANVGLLHYVNAGLRANVIFKKNVDYLVKNGEVLIVDEFTGRVMAGRRWSDGLHQAIETKEKVKVQSENQTLASITFQNYFRLYDKLSGMTGTADTEAYEFQDIYGLEVVVIPTHKTMIRDDLGDLIFMTRAEKFDAIVEDIRERVQAGQPVLVGTVSIEVSEHLSQQLKKENIAHQVLNAKHHEAESQIIANAGRPGTVTIATNMAGRGTDIVLGGMPPDDAKEQPQDGDADTMEAWKKRYEQVVEAGGLYIIGTERHESRRIDNQLRGRSGRQGDPGCSRFYLSLEDNLMRIFAGDKLRAIMDKLGIEKGEAIEHTWVTRAIENAQRKVEAHNFDIRKNLLEYDDIANEQRKVVYSQRDELLESDDVNDSIRAMITEVVHDVLDESVAFDALDWDPPRAETDLKDVFQLDLPISQWADNDDSSSEAIREKAIDKVTEAYESLETKIGSEQLRMFEKILMLQVLDIQWKEHLVAIDHLRQGIGLRGFAQKNPRQEYKRESFEMFEIMLERIRRGVVRSLFTLSLSEAVNENAVRDGADHTLDKVTYRHDEMPDALSSGEADLPAPDQVAPSRAARRRMQKQAYAAESGRVPPPSAARTVTRDQPKVKRNDPCFCGSGKKYKHCHGRS